MSLDGLRAWVGEVERKLGKRTRVFLALAVIAIGIAGAAVYLAIDARESSVSESDVQELQEKLETRIDELAAGGTAPPATAPLPEAEPEPAPIPEPQNGEDGNGGAGGGTGNGADGGVGSGTGGAAGSSTGDATGGGAESAKLRELLDQARERSEENE
ncbi:MAG: hypothetical protein WDZ46_05835 [Solirubrobacterales bacterium]